MVNIVPTGQPAAVMENKRERSVGGAHCPQIAWLLGNSTPYKRKVCTFML